jgi:hypothetical protein
MNRCKLNASHTGNIRTEYFGGFGWTSTKAVANWFDAQYERYSKDNGLKIHAHKRFGNSNARIGMERTIKV